MPVTMRTRFGGARIVDKTPEAFAETILALLEDEEALRRMGADGRENTLEQFDGKRTVQSFRERYAAISGSA